MWLLKQRTLCSLTLAAGTLVLLAVCMRLRASEDMDQIEPLFRQTYAYQTYLQVDAIRVEMKNGIVSLRGAVVDETHKILAQATVANMVGENVRVENQLVIDPPFTALSPDVYLARKVMLTLQFNRQVDLGRIYIEVYDGVVTLQGLVVDAGQKEQVLRLVADLSEVQGVRDALTVDSTWAPVAYETGFVSGVTVDDPSITALIVTMLRSLKSIRSSHTVVHTRQGEVTLTGSAMSEEQRAWIAAVVANSRGVRRVHNEMTIEPTP